MPASGNPGPRLPRRLALGVRRRPWGPGSGSLSRGRGRGDPPSPPRLPLSWVAEAPGLRPGYPGAQRRLSLPSGELELGLREPGPAEPGHTPSAALAAAPPKPGRPAGRLRTRSLAVRVTCCGAVRSPSRLPASDPEGRSCAGPGPGARQDAGPGALPEIRCCTARNGRIEKKKRFPTI